MSEKARICILTTIPGSIRAFYKGQIEAFINAGFNVTVVSSDDSKIKGELPEAVTFMPMPFSRSVSPFRDLKVLFSLWRLFRKKHFDIVQYSTPKASLLGSIASFLACVKIRIYILWGLYYMGQSGLKRKIFKSFEKLICALSTNIIPIAHQMVDFALLEGLGCRNKYEVMLTGSACGVDLVLFQPEKWINYRGEIRNELNIPDTGVVIGTVARLTGDKGINELVQAFGKLADDDSQIYLLLVGYREETDRLSTTTENIISNNPNIRYVGWKDNPLPYYSAMDIFCLPTYREGFGEVNLEAQAMGLPVVSTNVIGPSESIEDGVTGFLVESRNTEALVEPLRKLVYNPELRSKMGKLGIERVKQLFGRKDMIKAVLEHRINLLEK